jgi:hypothetical protein
VKVIRHQTVAIELNRILLLRRGHQVDKVLIGRVFVEQRLAVLPAVDCVTWLTDWQDPSLSRHHITSVSLLIQGKLSATLAAAGV